MDEVHGAIRTIGLCMDLLSSEQEEVDSVARQLAWQELARETPKPKGNRVKMRGVG